MKYILEQLQRHPSMQPQDIAKLCYQATFGAEHMLTDPERAKAFLCKEFEQTPMKNEPLFENISAHYCRVNLGAWKYHGYSIETLFSLFLQTANAGSNATAQDLERRFNEIAVFAQNGTLPFCADEWTQFLSSYDRKPLHHSEAYRNNEKPAYRIVWRDLLCQELFI